MSMPVPSRRPGPESVTPDAGRSSPASKASTSSSRSDFVMIPLRRFVVDQEVVSLPFCYGNEPFLQLPQGLRVARDEEIERIRSYFLDEQTWVDPFNPPSFWITGLGGSGKSTLARTFASQHQDQYDTVFFLTADSEDRLRSQYSNLAQLLKLVDDADIEDEERCVAIFKTWLANPIKSARSSDLEQSLCKWLLVFDNVEVTELVKQYRPSGTHGNILLTTRNPVLSNSEYGPSGNCLLQGLPPHKGADLLRLRARDNEPNDHQTMQDAMTISRWLEGNPMAVTLLGSLIHDDLLSISRFLKSYPTKSSLFGRLNQKSLDGVDNINLTTYWAIDTMYTNRPDVFELLALISMLDTHGIEHDFLKPRANTVSRTGARVTPERYNVFRKHLAHASLIEQNPRTETVRVHHVVRDVTVDLTVRKGIAATTFGRALDRVAEQWPFINRVYVTGAATRVERWQKCAAAYQHVLRLRDVHLELEEHDVQQLPDSAVAELLLEAAQ
jgi:hypothetical protein